MRIAEFDQLPVTEAGALVRQCAAVPSFVSALVDGRPHGSVEALLTAARAQAAGWTDAEVSTALADHPRIGERAAGGGPGAALSSREQAGVDPADAHLRHRLAEGNRRYEERFGRIYLVRAAGRTGPELLDLLEQRLTNDPATELAVTRGQLTEIALLRLEGLLTP
ncbi:2-oxo-4-hydroxy-4-carboxy-5-ureidoimidazoline decarboxylase [Modestobacter roseus]|uniref:2-oxo-4-hydroxy-4-carboxy-5-ureidoimidazoline decarboxylase n=1 Tax=Modestobacter roseus TaxID=1181884 RepID=A0A562IPP5_9ACTN|nr:2-oxo-4-hydroxy-4-carboxy-5-ureidoimidazoline decarboxylase [Modestobacter roseus]MQA34320.1 2-oxo-4-hydroxy-4-carboxy-5-ureidoimidazoline decarboxylase [Modestobacter roseus]TWH72961.1 2-oxo-4-hydroxy-4-carboxy-5-ureidoimidazoline decarboxylase [Modestobacter roseus]